MVGDLVGCWYTDEFNVVQENRGGGFKASGTEHFDGCLDANHDGCSNDEKGVFRTTFAFTAKFAPTGDEIHGRCHHPIVGGSEPSPVLPVSSRSRHPERGSFPVSRAY